MKRLIISVRVKKTGFFPTSCAGIIFFVAALLLIIPMYAVEAQSAPSGAKDFEIPIKELSREQKDSPVKPVPSKPQKKKKSASRARRSKATTVAPGAAAPQNLPLQPETAQPFRIFNVPYSFVVTGKSTVIKAVIYREADDLRMVNCRIGAAATGAVAVVKMAKVDGFRFTYAATLPEVASDAASLRYTIVAIDVSGTESISPEFATPVSFSPLVPGWQF